MHFRANSPSFLPLPREHLLQNGNEGALADVDSAIFCLVLEGHVHDSPEGFVDMFLHGDGSSRWFDKSFSLIVAENGETGLNFEHAWGDGGFLHSPTRCWGVRGDSQAKDCSELK